MEQKRLVEQTIHLYAATKQIFTPEEIDRIIAQGLQLQSEEAVVNGGQVVNTNTRTCRIGWFYPGADTNWIFDKIIDDGRLSLFLSVLDDKSTSSNTDNCIFIIICFDKHFSLLNYFFTFVIISSTPKYLFF